MSTINELRDRLKKLTRQGYDYVKEMGKYADLKHVLPAERTGGLKETDVQPLGRKNSVQGTDQNAS